MSKHYGYFYPHTSVRKNLENTFQEFHDMMLNDVRFGVFFDNQE